MNENGPQFSGVNNYPLPQKKPKQLTLAVMSFVLSLFPVLMCCCTMFPAVTVFLILLALLAAFLGILSLALHKDGKGFAITGIVISLLMIFPMLFSLIFLRGVNADLITFSQEPERYISEYEQTGEIPEEFEEYEDPKYDWVWKMMGAESFEQFYSEFIRQYKQQNGWMFESSSGSSSSRSDSSSSKSSSESSSRPSNYGEDPITI